MIVSINSRNIIEGLAVEKISIFILWLFHVTAIIGVSIGYFDFFIPKTPLNLLIALSLLILNYKIDTLKKCSLMVLFFAVGIFVEWIGIHYNFLFGTYSYGVNLGWKLDGVPWLIGVNWALLVLITGTVANKIKAGFWLKVFFGAFLMVFLDFFMEFSAPIFDFWTFKNGIAPLQNYIAWFAIASGLHVIFQRANIFGNFKIAVHMYVCQLVFFGFFFFYYI